MPRPTPRRCLDQVAGLVLVALAAARAMHDDLGALHRLFDPPARGQVTPHELDTLPALLDTLSAFAAASAEHSDDATGVEQPRDDEPPQGARAAGDQDG